MIVCKIVIGLSGVTVTKTVVGMGAGHVPPIGRVTTLSVTVARGVVATTGIERLLPLSLVGSSGGLPGVGIPGNGPEGTGAEKAPNGPVMTVVKPLGRVEVKVPMASVAWPWDMVKVSVKLLVRVVVSVVEGPSYGGGEPGGP